MSADEKLGVFVSGGGRSLENLAERHADGTLPARVSLVISDRPGVFALERAERLGIATLVLPWKSFDGPEAFSHRAFEALDEAGCRLGVLAGFLRKLVVPQRWRGRVLNIHPALLPAFGGKGFYGHRVHQAVLDAGVQSTGCTVHQVDDEYDHGKIVLQRIVEVAPDDTADSLAARVFEEEKLALPEAILRTLRGLGS